VGFLFWGYAGGVALTHQNGTKTSLGQGIKNEVTTGSGTSTLTIHAADDSELASFALPTPTGPSIGRVFWATLDLEATVGSSGDASYGRINDRDGLEVMRGDCGVGSGEFQLSKLALVAGKVLRITTSIMTWNPPP
jgi:hypothetical protein